MGGKPVLRAYYIKKGLKTIIDNYRQITSLQSIDKIRETVISSRISLLLIHLTDENQCEYNTHKSAIDIIFAIKQKFINKIKDQLLVGLSKSFGRIGGNKLRWVLY